MNIVFDLDGTLADDKHRKHHLAKSPKDWDAYFEACDGDTPHRHVVKTFFALKRDGHRIDIWSARGEGCGGSVRKTTVNWLLRECGIRVALNEAYGDSFHGLRMRPHDDRRDDTLLKREWINDARAAGRAPHLVFEDRQRVVDMWRAEGVPCFQVAPGDF